MAVPDTGADGTSGPTAGPVLFAYDGSELAAVAIAEAGNQLLNGREAVVVCVWQPVDVGFVPPDGRHLTATDATEVRRAAEETSAHGAALAEAAGFRAQSIAIEAARAWKGIVAIARERGAELIVFGSHCRSGLSGRLRGSVTSDVMKHSAYSVLVVRGR
jgi:nucleotide-binding universal stress UspA family protein